MHLLINLNDIIIIIVVVIVFTGYGGFAVVNTVVVEKNIPVLFKIEFYSNPVLNLLIFLNDNDYKNRIDKYNSEDEKISISLFYQCCDNYF